jgi:hypothetical protein
MKRGLVILITNIGFAYRGGSEVVTRDLALGLQRRGHRPIVYSPQLGEIAADVTSRGVVAIDDLAKLAEAPDIIHGHHSIPCGEALIRFPETPALFVCHSFSFWIEAPIHFPQIGAYVAVDEACRDRLVHSEAIDPSRVLVLPNGVDLRRFPERNSPLAQRPARAVAFGKAGAAPEIAAACERLGIPMTNLGVNVYRREANPERQLVGADLVFASARAALEGLCAGAAVVVCDARGLCGMVTTANYESLRARNFGLRSLGEEVTVDQLIEAVGAYDAVDAQHVSQRAREEADLEKLLDRYEALYEEILSGSRRPTITAEAHRKAVERFMHDNLPRRMNDPRWPWRSERDAFQTQIEKLEARLAATATQAQVIAHLRAPLAGATTALQAEQAEAARLKEALVATTNERDALLRLVNSRTGLARRLLSMLLSKGKPGAKRPQSPG